MCLAVVSLRFMDLPATFRWHMTVLPERAAESLSSKHKIRDVTLQHWPASHGAAQYVFGLSSPSALSSHSAAHVRSFDVGGCMTFLQDEQPKPRPPSADGAAAAAAAAPAPCEQLFCGAFAVLDRQWLARKATYMDFPAVMK